MEGADAVGASRRRHPLRLASRHVEVEAAVLGHGYHDVARIRQDVAEAGFGSITIDTVTAQSVAPSALIAATAYCHGTVLRTPVDWNRPARPLP